MHTTKDGKRNAQIGIENENRVFSYLQWHNKKTRNKSEAAAVFKRENEPQADTDCVRESSKWK